MNCSQVEHILEAYIDGEMAAADARAVAEHHMACSKCNKLYMDALGIRVLLQKCTVPSHSENFVDRILEYAARTSSIRNTTVLAMFGSAIAAGLAAWFIVSGSLLTAPVTPSPQTDSNSHLFIVSNETRTIKLAIDSDQPLDGVEMSIELTPNLELAGFGSRRVINWDTQLKQGSNVIRLPITGLAAGDGTITARVRMKGKEKIMHIQTQYRAPGNAWLITYRAENIC